MSNLIPINKDEFETKSWGRPTNFTFSAKDTLCAVSLSELRQATLVMPMAFVPINEEFHLVAVLGLFGGKNQFVDMEGKWLGSYIPLLYRLYPFRLAESDTSEKIICFDNTLNLLRSDTEGEAFYESGKPTSLLAEVIATFSIMEEGLSAIKSSSKIISDLGLLKEWEITIEIAEAKHAVTGLYCIDESKLSDLKGDGLEKLQQSNALEIIYAQLFSMRHIQVFAQLAESIQVSDKSQRNVFDDFDGGTLNFDNL